LYCDEKEIFFDFFINQLDHIQVVLEQNERRVPPPGRGDWQHSPRRAQLFYLQVRKEGEKKWICIFKTLTFLFIFLQIDC
jgi:hypothetical protein